jgi:DNA-binding NarL/FixJ family response regulator
MQSMKRVKVAVLHEDPVVATGLAALLAHQADLDVSADATPLASDVVVADYRSAVTLANQWREDTGFHKSAAPKIMIVTKLDREWEVRSAIDSGVHGYLLQGCHPDELLACVRALGRGSRFLSQAVTHTIADSLNRDRLTSREEDVLRLLACGLCNKSIGRDLGIAVGTVKAHIKAILEKLDATSRTHAIVVATQRGLIGGEHPYLPEAAVLAPAYALKNASRSGLITSGWVAHMPCGSPA